jgi:hypothetical protein
LRRDHITAMLMPELAEFAMAIDRGRLCALDAFA